LIISFVNNEFNFENVYSFENSTTHKSYVPIYQQVLIDNDNWKDIPFLEIEKEFLILPFSNNFNLKN
jgi:hypothetical protein